eukprot:8940002-Pyramimonas_sp.AAC.1
MCIRDRLYLEWACGLPYPTSQPFGTNFGPSCSAPGLSEAETGNPECPSQPLSLGVTWARSLGLSHGRQALFHPGLGLRMHMLDLLGVCMAESRPRG